MLEPTSKTTTTSGPPVNLVTILKKRQNEILYLLEIQFQITANGIRRCLASIFVKTTSPRLALCGHTEDLLDHLWTCSIVECTENTETDLIDQTFWTKTLFN